MSNTYFDTATIEVMASAAALASVSSTSYYEAEIYEQLKPLAAGRVNVVKLYSGELKHKPFATR